MLRLLHAAAVAALATSLPAKAVTINFTQNGFADAATIMGSFTGEDSTMDGILSLADGEISAFSVGFGGNSIVGAFSLDLGDLVTLSFGLDAIGAMGAGAFDALDTVVSVGAAGRYVTGEPLLDPLCLILGCGAGTVVDGVTGASNPTAAFATFTSDLAPPPSPIPLPPSVWMMLAALIGLGVVERARRSAP